MSLKVLFTILAVSMLTIGTLAPALAVSPKAYSLENNLEIETLDASDEQLYVPGEILVKFNPGVSEEKIKAINSKNSATVTYTSPYAGFKKLNIPKTKSVEEMVEIYSKNPNVEYAVPNAITHAFTDDYYYGEQWNFHDTYGINIEPAWDISTGSGVVVAVLDTGVAYEDYVQSPAKRYYQAPDLVNTHFIPGYDFVNDDTHPNDDDSHGTHVTGTIAQSTNNGFGVAGIAYNCSIMPVKVLGPRGGTLDQLVDGIYFATDGGANVISMSLGFSPGYYPGAALDDALDYAYNNGVTIVAAAGNDETGTVSYPAAYEKCIAVGATTSSGELASYSNYGQALDVVAPGSSILQNTFDPFTQDTSDFGFWYFSGTSMATPHVSGVAALLIANAETNGKILTPYEVRTAIESTARDLGNTSWDPEYGWGLVDAYAALTYSGEIPNQAPSAVMDIPYIAYIGETIIFDASNSTDPDGEITSYYWDFGDGNNATGVSVTHVYNDFNDYIVNLTVTDNKGATDTASEAIAIVPPNEAPIAVMNIPGNTNVGETVIFDASASKDPDGGIMAYSWDFGDGSFGSGISTAHTYNIAENYTVELTVTDYEGATNTTSGTITVIQPNRPPIADMDMPSSAYVGDVIAFDASGSTDPDGDSMTYSWDFGDGNTSDIIDPQHVYTNAGIYEVSLTVSDGEEIDTATGTIEINEMPVNEAPSALIIMPASAYAGDSVTFDASESTDSDGSIVSYYWEFGDGNTSDEVNPQHIYTAIGLYNVTLTVTDNEGATDTASRSIDITETPITPPAVTVKVTPVTKKAGKNVFAYATATVTVMQGENPVSGAIVIGHWEDTTTDSDSATTDEYGMVTVVSDSGKYPRDSSLDFTFVIDSITVSGNTYTDGSWTDTGSY